LTEYTRSVALGDVDGDGDLDLVCGNFEQSNTFYLNTGGTFETSPSWRSGLAQKTVSVALGDVDRDGDLDLACGNSYKSNTLHRNTGDAFETWPSWATLGPEYTNDVALGDVDEDGDLDVICGNLGHNTLYSGKAAPVFKGNLLSPTRHLPNNGAHLRSVVAEKMSPEYYRVSFTAKDVESDPIWLVPEYQFKGNPTWHAALVSGQTGKVGSFATSPAGILDSLEWDTHLLPFDPRDVILRLRVIEIPKRVSVIQHVAPYLKEIGPVIPYRQMISTVDVLSFPAVTLGDTTSVNLQVTNRGTADLTITNIDLPTPDMRLEDPLPIEIAPKGSAELTIRLSPGSDAEIQGTLVIRSDDPFSPSTVVHLSASVRALDFTLANLYPTGEISQNTPLNVSVTMQDYVRVDSARVFFREGGRASFDILRLQRIDDPMNEQYYGLIPASSVTPRGIEYFVEVYNDRFTREDLIRRLRTRVKNMDFAGTPPAERYGMISLPLEMDGPILGVFSDDLGGQDIAQWRLWVYEGCAAAYAELPNDTTTHFELGRGYWLITRSAPAIDTGPAEGLSTPTDAPFEIALHPGWNMVGSPFAFPVAWSSCEVDTLTMSEAVAQGVTEPLWRWVPSTGRYEQNVTVLAPFEGYWVKNTTDPPRDVVLRVPPVEASAGALVTAVADDEDGAWEIGIRVTCGDADLDHNRVGVRPGAHALRDLHDRFEPPMGPGESVSLYFPHFGWERYAGRYAVDIRGVENNNGHTWAFDVAKNFSRETAGDEIVVEFSGIEAIPENLDVLLIDRKIEHRVDLRKEARYAFFQGKRDPVMRDEDARFGLLVGSDQFIDTHEGGAPPPPLSTVLHQNRPNPFNPSTIIQYELAQPGHVTVKIYDVSGALVRTLEDRDRQPGRYEIGWTTEDDRGSRVSSGVYFYRMETRGFTQTRKLVILK
jgi:hypothetical protein